MQKPDISIRLDKLDPELMSIGINAMCTPIRKVQPTVVPSLKIGDKPNGNAGNRVDTPISVNQNSKNE